MLKADGRPHALKEESKMTKEWWEKVSRCRDAKEFGKVLVEWFNRHDTPDSRDDAKRYESGLKSNGSR